MPINRPWEKIWVLLVCSIVGVAGCKTKTSRKAQSSRQVKAVEQGRQERNGYPVRVLDDRGKAIVMSQKPQRIVVAGTALYAEVLIDLGAKKRIVGITKSPNTPPILRDVPSIGRPWPLNLEKVLAVRPDLILGTFGVYRSKLEQISKIPIYTGGKKNAAITSLADIYSIIRKLDKLLYGNQRRAMALLKKIKSEIKKIQARRPSRKRVRVAILYMPEAKSSRIYIVGKRSPAHELLQMAGGQNVFAQQKAFAVNIELLVKQNPDVIITDPKHINAVKTHPALQRLKAIINQRVYGIKASHYTSSRVTRVYRKLIKTLQK